MTVGSAADGGHWVTCSGVRRIVAAAHKTAAPLALFKRLRALLAARPNRRASTCPTPRLDFDLGEMADTIRETTQRFAADKIAPIAAEIDEKDEFPRAAVAADGRARAARHHRRGGMMAGSASAISSMSSRRRKWRAPRPRSASATAPTPTCASTRSAAGRTPSRSEISAQADQRRACRRAGDERGGRGQRRRRHEAEGREDAATAIASTAPNSGSPTAPMPTRWSSMPRPARAAAASPPS